MIAAYPSEVTDVNSKPCTRLDRSPIAARPVPAKGRGRLMGVTLVTMKLHSIQDRSQDRKPRFGPRTSFGF